MSLSNTATPIYYGQFRQQVQDGIVPISREIAMEMERIDALIANPNFYYDDQAINGFILYCEQELTLTDGSDFTMLFSFKLWAEQIFGWYYFLERQVYQPNGEGGGDYVIKRYKRRLTVKQYLIVARGAAKSMYASCLQSYFLNVDPTTTHQITTAPTMKQAEEVMSPIITSIARHRGPVFKFLTQGSLQNTTGNRALRQKLASTKVGIQNFLTESRIEVRPMTINKLQGLRVKLSTVDEWLSGDLREDVVGAIEQGASKVDDYLIVAISSEGTVRNGSGDDIKMELAKILRGEYQAPHISIWHYKLDEVEEVGNEAMWVKANPNIGLPGMVSYEIYQLDVERAENAPASRNDILAKRFGLPREGYSYFFTYPETLPHGRVFVRGMPCALGADLSQGDDFCAFTFLFPINIREEQFGVKTRSYISEHSLKKLRGSMRQKYEEFINEGSLFVMKGSVLDMEDVYDDLQRYIETESFDVQCLGYDPYNSKAFLQRYQADYGDYGIEKVIQGVRSESVPLGELKILAGQRKLYFDQALMKFAMGNAITLEDTNGNRKLLKMRRDAKIDNVAALMDAWIAYKVFKDLFE